MAENGWYAWRSITFDDSYDDGIHVVRYDDKYPIDQHIIMKQCLRYENFEYGEDSCLISVEGLTNNKPTFARFTQSSKFDNWFKRVMWYVKRQYQTILERMKIDGITLLCLISDQQNLQTILCGRQDDCFCENIPSLDWLRILSSITTHSHLEPICICEFSTDEDKKRALKLNQSMNVK